jgi:hypothetical protein
MHNARADNGVPLEKVGAPSVKKLDGDGALRREREGGWLNPKSETSAAPSV